MIAALTPNPIRVRSQHLLVYMLRGAARYCRECCGGTAYTDEGEVRTREVEGATRKEE